MDLAQALTRPDPDPAVVSALVVTVQSDGRVILDLGAGRQVPAAVLSWWTPAPGAVVEALRRDAASWLVLGPVRTSNPASVGFMESLAFPFNVSPGVGVVANPLVLSASSVASWRENDGWSAAGDARQGAYQSAVWGYWRGCYFYPQSSLALLAGRTCTRLRVTLVRTSNIGNSAATPQFIAPHVHEGQPAGSPLFLADAVNAGSLAWNGVGTFDLPVAWGQALIDRTAKGLGHVYLGTAYYSACKTLAAYAASGQITLDWQ